MTSMCLSVVQEPSKNWKKPWPWEGEGVCMQGLSPILGSFPHHLGGAWSFSFVNHVLCKVVKSFISMSSMWVLI